MNFSFKKPIYLKKIVENKFLLVSFLIVSISIFFRFWNYFNRWGLAYDQAQFSVVARYALETIQLPLLGPFSSGGPFQTGGEWYWLVMIGTFIYPDSILSSWVFITLLTVFSVIVMIYAGKVLYGSVFGLILGFLMAVSPAQIFQSTNLTNQTPIIFFSSLSVLFAVLYIKKSKHLFIFLSALMVGIGTSIHIQSVALIPFITLIYLMFSKNFIKDLLLVFAGLAFPWIPVLIADFQNNFNNTIQMLTYFTNDQAKASYQVLGRRWLTFGTEFIPSSWGKIIGGNILVGYLLIISVGVLFIWNLIRRNIRKEIFVIALGLLSMFVILRYIRTPLFESFYVFMHPFVIFLSGWFIYFVYKKNKILGSVLLLIILFSSIYTIWGPINNATNNTYLHVKELKELLYKEYPNSNFSIYDYDYNNRGTTMPLVLNLYIDKRISDNGKKIGIFRATEDEIIRPHHKLLYGYYGHEQIYDISASSSSKLVEFGWVNANPKSVYNETQYWFKD